MSIMNINRRELRVELGRFFESALEFQKETGKSAMMPVCIVDEDWHKLMQNQSEYSAFTKQHVNMPVEHDELKGSGEIEWVNHYHNKFGLLPTPWFVSPSGEYDQHAHQEYLRTGVLKMSWKCNPRFVM